MSYLSFLRGSPVKIRPAPVFAAFVAGFLLVACAADDAPEYVETPVDELYNAAVDSLEAGNYDEAAEKFESVEGQHPYSKWSTEAQLNAAYSYYRVNKYEEAIAGFDRFVTLHPSNPKVAYAYYMKALSYYEQISDVARDQGMTENAMSTLRELLKRFPNSKFARDARVKLDLTHDQLAGKEMDIGRYYLNQGHYLAAINRFQQVVNQYETTTHIPEALHRMTEAYLALGIKSEAKKTAAILGHNYPGSEWYIDSYELIEDKQVRPKEEDPWYKVW